MERRGICWNSPLCAAANQQEHNQFPSRRLSIDGSFLTSSCLKNSLLQWGERNKQPSLSWERPPYLPAYSLSTPRGEPQERGSCSGNWLLLTFVSAEAVHWPFPHLCGNPPALNPISAPESDPKVMCGKEQKREKQGGTATKSSSIATAMFCRKLMGKKESTE